MKLLCDFARMMEQRCHNNSITRVKIRLFGYSRSYVSTSVFNPQQHQNNIKRFTERDLELLKQMPPDTSPSLTREVDNKHGGKRIFSEYTLFNTLPLTGRIFTLEYTNYAEVDISTARNNIVRKTMSATSTATATATPTVTLTATAATATATATATPTVTATITASSASALSPTIIDGLKSKFMDYNDNMANLGIFSSQSSSVDGLKQLTLGKDVNKKDQNIKSKQVMEWAFAV